MNHIPKAELLFFLTKANENIKVQRNVIYFSFLTKIAFVGEVST